MPFEHLSYGALFLLLVLGGVGFPLPEDVPLLAAGALLHGGTLSWLPAFVTAYSGVLIGDSLVYVVGRRSKASFEAMSRWLNLLTTQPSERLRTWFERFGVWSVIGARFTPGMRLPMYLWAGAMRMPYVWFLLADASAALISVPAWLAIGFFGASRIDALGRDISRIEHWLGLAGVVALVILAAYTWFRFRAAPFRDLLMALARGRSRKH